MEQGCIYRRFVEAMGLPNTARNATISKNGYRIAWLFLVSQSHADTQVFDLVLQTIITHFLINHYLKRKYKNVRTFCRFLFNNLKIQE